MQPECFQSVIEWSRNWQSHCNKRPVPLSADFTHPTAPNKCGSAIDPFSAYSCDGYSFSEREAFRNAVEKMLD